MRIQTFLAAAFLALACWTQARADFGNRFIVERRNSVPLDKTSQKISYRFTCQEDMTTQAAAVFCVEALDPPAYRLSLQADEKGLPSGIPLASCSYVPKAQRW